MKDHIYLIEAITTYNLYGTRSTSSGSDCSAMWQIQYSRMPTCGLFNNAVNGTHYIAKGKGKVVPVFN
jgi:hypothetical protein